MNSYFRFIPRYASVLALFLTLFLPSLAHAATLNVPTTAYPTIQAAIQAAANGDTVLVAAGTYRGVGNRDIDFGGKSLTVMSQAGAGSTIIDCGGYSSTDGSGNHRGFYIHSGEKNVTISGFTVKNGYETYIYTIPDSENGGGVLNDNNNGAITLTDCTITGNTATYGGGVNNSNNSHSSSGGSGTIMLTDCTITGNTATYGEGGGVYNSNNSHSSGGGSGAITLTNCTITGNNVINGGGGVYNYNYRGAITLTNCTITGNTATNGGGEGGGGVLNDNVNNNNSHSSGGGSGAITLTNCTITGNTATNGGGGVYNYNLNYSSSGAITLTNCTITGNTANAGGGVDNYNSSRGGGSGAITLNNCTITGNNVINRGDDRDGGGGVYNDNENGAITLTNCTITGNTANAGGGVYNYNYGDSGSGAITLNNDIIYGDVGGEVFTWIGSTTPAIVSYCDVQGGSSGTGNINADPQFVNAAYGDLRLKFGSPCLSKGTPTGAPATDKDGNTRPNPPSMGAYDTNASANPLLLPVLLVHGTFGKAQDWDSGMSQRLAAEGFIVDTINFATEPETLSNETYIELQAAAIGRRVQELEDRTGQRHICIVCHSMGGLAARYYLEHLNLWPVHLDQSRQAGVDKLILLGTPNWGFDAPLLDPVSTITQAHRMTLPISSNGYDSLARDTYDNWSPAVKEMFAEWQPAPVGDGRGGYAYPSGYKLWSWPTNLFGNYKTTIQPLNSYAFAEFYKSIWYTTKYVPQGFNSSDYDAVAGVLSEFPLLPSTDTVHLDYYTKTAQLLGVMYPDNAKTPGVDGRLVSPFLKTLNTTPDNSGAKIYLVGGTSPAALTYEAYGHILTVLGPYNDSLPNDGIVPTDSALGQDPITGVYLYPHATKAIVGVGHTSLTSDPDVINQVVEWLKNAPASSKTHVLWHSPDGRATLWSVNPDGSFSTSQAYGPYRDGGGLWQAVALATGPNGVSRILWHSPDGRATIWHIYPDGSFDTSEAYGPYVDGGGTWQAVAVSVGPDNVAHILWHSPDGRATLWFVNPDGTHGTSQAYGPYTDGGGTWQAIALATGPNGVSRILWRAPDGRATLWHVYTNGSFDSSQAYGSYRDSGGLWQATAVSVGPDNVAHILWTAPDGRSTLWFVNPDGSFGSSPAYGPYADGSGLWQATALASGPDNVAHILWHSPDGRATIWFVNPDGTHGTSQAYGPYVDGGGIWQATAVSAGP